MKNTKNKKNEKLEQFKAAITSMMVGIVFLGMHVLLRPSDFYIAYSAVLLALGGVSIFNMFMDALHTEGYL